MGRFVVVWISAGQQQRVNETVIHAIDEPAAIVKAARYVARFNGRLVDVFRVHDDGLLAA